MKRENGRSQDSLRKLGLEMDFVPCAEGSVLISMGNTRVLCNASIEESVPPWMKSQEEEGGWITAEYSMLPRSGLTRSRRERHGPGGRSQEIQRLIGRSLRASVDLRLLGQRTITVDCDVIQADGGTRTASITGGYIALRKALNDLIAKGKIPSEALLSPVAAISAGIIDNQVMLDLCYEEDVAAEVDANFVMNKDRELIEVQGTAEGNPFSRDLLNKLLDVAEKGILELIEEQERVLTP